MIMFTENNYNSFKERLDDLRYESYEAYNKRTKKYASYCMNYDENNPPDAYIRKEIQKCLK